MKTINLCLAFLLILVAQKAFANDSLSLAFDDGIYGAWKVSSVIPKENGGHYEYNNYFFFAEKNVFMDVIITKKDGSIADVKVCGYKIREDFLSICGENFSYHRSFFSEKNELTIDVPMGKIFLEKAIDFKFH